MSVSQFARRRSFIVLQTVPANRIEVEENVEAIDRVFAERARGPHQRRNAITFCSQLDEVQVEVIRLARAKEPAPVVISGAIFANGGKGAQLAKAIKRLSPQALFLIFSRFGLRWVDMNDAIDAVIPRLQLDEHNGSEYDVLVAFLCAHVAETMSIADCKALVPQLYLPADVARAAAEEAAATQSVRQS